MANYAATHIDLFDRAVQETHDWLGEVMSESGLRDRHYALQALRSVLHAVRDELSVEQNAGLSAQLPTMIRGLYFEGWVPSRSVEHTSRETFVRKIRATLPKDLRELWP